MLTLPLLKALWDDPDRYVTRSVANHLGDIGKDHLELLIQTCSSWLEELDEVPDENGQGASLAHSARSTSPRQEKERCRPRLTPTRCPNSLR